MTSFLTDAAASHNAGASRPPPRAPAAAGAPCVASEAGRLRAVLLHRPGDELCAVDPGAPGRTLFAAAVSPEDAGREHDAFAAALRGRGVEVLILGELVEEALADASAVEGVLADALPDVTAADRDRIAQLGPADAAGALIAGTAGRRAGDGAALPELEALPNLLYTRDPSAWVGGGVAVADMARALRRRETLLTAALYRWHPRFAGAPAWTAAAPGGAVGFEGGDVLVPFTGEVVVGISERTSAEGARTLVTALLETGAADAVTTVRVPPEAGFHLDLVLTVVDHDAVAVWAPVRPALAAHRWTMQRAGPRARALDDIASAFGRPVRIIEIERPGDPPPPRPWDHGVNVLAVAPGVVVAYE